MRLASIDILRAMTMVLMIWVNDFWTLTEVPKWLTHATATEDYLGFSDIIFPLFLFIVGLSIPYALRNRLTKNQNRWLITKHILIRSLSLLLIGVYMVNYETVHTESMVISKNLWCILMALAVVLIWTNWKRSPVSKKWHTPIQGIGLSVLLLLAIVYKGGISGEHWMRPQWWGILGLIGWAYLLNALVFLYSRGNLVIILLLWGALNGLAVLNQFDMAIEFGDFTRYFSTILTGTVPAFTTAGIVATLIFQKLSDIKMKWNYVVLVVLGIACIGYGLSTRPLWGISKIQGTPSWLGICTGIGFLLFVIIHFIADLKKQTKWAKLIAPAGTATLTCYMIPYFVYPLRNMMGIRFPEVLNTSTLGLLLSFVFAMLVVIFTGWLEKRGYKLKL